MKLRLSEAIRLGAMMKPQGFHGFAGDTSSALAAASEACGIPYRLDPLVSKPFVDYGALREQFPILNLPVSCACGNASFTFSDLAILIWHTNDHHFQTREFLANFVEQIENQLEQVSAQAEGALTHS